MLLPVERHHPLTRKIWLVHALLAANALIFFATLAAGLEQAVGRWGFTPASPRPDSFFTCMFLHADIFHLGGNLFFLWAFGDNLEDRLGAWLFAGTYLFTGTFATFSHWMWARDAAIPVVGASGAISGLMGFYAVMFPKARFQLFLMLSLRRFAFIPLGRWTSAGFMGAWAGLQALGLALYQGRTAGVAYMAHLGGAAAGVVLALALSQSGHIVVDREAGAQEPPRKKKR